MGKRKRQIALMSQSILVKDKNKKIGNRSLGKDSFLHTTELDDGITYNRINFQSVTEQNNLEDFLTTAEMAGKDFTAERQNVQIVANSGQGIRLTAEDIKKISDAQNEHRALLQIPRRPIWDSSTTKEQLILMERDSFTDWRRQLKMLEEYEHIQLTPYEKNLDFWRQLWRVIERSDVVVQIVDARNPLLFRCEDLDRYVKEVDPRKTVMLLINKADFLNENQRCQWVEYFNREGLTAVFFSAKVEKESCMESSETETSSQHSNESEEDEDAENTEEEDSGEDINADKDDDDDTVTELQNLPVPAQSSHSHGDNSNPSDPLDNKIQELSLGSNQGLPINDDKNCCSNLKNSSHTDDGKTSSDISDEACTAKTESLITNKPDIVTTHELLAIFRKLAEPSTLGQSDKQVTTIGMVGYPNVGKSSTINVLLEKKQLGVSARPGKTKHLQTLFLDEHLVLCDCPGLVFPSFVATRAHLVINGILPIDELRDHISPVTLISFYLNWTVHFFFLTESTYSLMIPRPSSDDMNPDRKPTAEELLSAYGAMHGFMTARGTPDCPRSARYILKDYVKGKLLYCEPPPGIAGPEFQDKERINKIQALKPVKFKPLQMRSDVDKEFFHKNVSKVHSKGVMPVGRTDNQQQGSAMGSQLSLASSVSGKPWKKHNNRNRKEKLRRVHKDLDFHN
ncbi:large subunit GTPase 1 [Bulinus truncatus]|nr:large subunit GTPase 1 [Bulinus truncatus]